jgi:hypothetical protein
VPPPALGAALLGFVRSNFLPLGEFSLLRDGKFWTALCVFVYNEMVILGVQLRDSSTSRLNLV